jgi:hypothetical protein
MDQFRAQFEPDYVPLPDDIEYFPYELTHARGLCKSN